MKKVIRTTTISFSLDVLLKGQLKFLNRYYETIAVSGQDNFLDIVREREQVRTISVEMERGISPVKDLKSLVHLYKVLKEEKPQIVHSLTPKAGLLTMLAGKLARVPIRIHTFTGLVFPTKTGFIKKLLIQMDKVLCWAATDIIPEGNGVKQDLIKYKITKKPLNVLANGNVNGIDITYFDPSQYSLRNKEVLRHELNIKKSDFVFVLVARLVSDKGINELVDAFKSIEHKECKLLLVGPVETEQDPLLPKTLEEINTNTNIISVGFQSDVRPYLAISNALTFPSYREGFPNVVLQAGAMGLPAIVTNINGCNEIIKENINGVIIPVKDVVALKNAMLRFLEDKNLVNKLRLNARQTVVDQYENSTVWNALRNKYELLLQKHNQ